jgi:hypothetical protein
VSSKRLTASTSAGQLRPLTIRQSQFLRGRGKTELTGGCIEGAQRIERGESAHGVKTSN